MNGPTGRHALFLVVKALAADTEAVTLPPLRLVERPVLAQMNNKNPASLNHVPFSRLVGLYLDVTWSITYIIAMFTSNSPICFSYRLQNCCYEIKNGFVTSKSH